MNNNGDAIRRASLEKRNYSKQARFREDNGNLSDLFASYYNWSANPSSEEEEPKYELASRKRDVYLLNKAKQNPNISGIMSSVIDIDKNRGWRMVGGRNQVSRFTDMFHNIQAAPGVYGWRPSISFLSKAFWGTNMGFVLELGRDGKDGPIREMYTVDPTRCRLTGNPVTPLEYTKPSSQNKRYWRTADFIRGASKVSTNEDLHGLGHCAMDRALTLSKLMMALYEHDFEAIGASATRGLLLLQGISASSWTKAMEAREAELDSKGYEYYGALAVLASAAKSVDAKLIALSELPKSFNMREFMDMLMYGFALCFGYDPSEFWPVQFGAMGRGTEMEVQHEKATGKGRLDFPLTLQEQAQGFLPDSLEFMFDQRDEKGDLLHASVNQAWVSVVTSMKCLISVEESRVLLADYGVIPRSWAPTDTASQTDLAEVDPEEAIEGEIEPTPSEPADMQDRVQNTQYKLIRDELKQRGLIGKEEQQIVTEQRAGSRTARPESPNHTAESSGCPLRRIASLPSGP